MRSLNARQLMIASLIATLVIEVVTLIFRFCFLIRPEVSPAYSVGMLLAGIRIHHGFFGLLFLFLAMLLRRSKAVLVPWFLVLGIGLLASDIVHHFVILAPILGDPEFLWFDPVNPD